MSRRPPQPDFFEPGPDPAARFNAGMARAAAARGLKRAVENHTAEIELLVPLARELAQDGREITVSTLRAAAYDLGTLSGSETGRDLSYLGAVMRRAGLKPTGRFARSELVVTHGNLQVIWKLPTQLPNAPVGEITGEENDHE